MSERKLCGYDLNGWRDRAARNSLIGPDGEKIAQLHISRSVLRPAVVRVADDLWVGGAQAALAPHGRGGGWGDVGDPLRREPVVNLLARSDAPSERVAAALSGLAMGAKVCAVAIDDHPSRSEDLQERLLAAVAKGKLGQGLLVWRSVLAVLGSLSDDNPQLHPHDGMTLGIIGHVAEGFTLQHLRLRKETGRKRDIFAPERRHAATAVSSSLGYAGLFARAQDDLIARHPQHRGNWAEHASATAALALGDATQEELLRNERGDFFVITPPRALNLPATDLPPDMAKNLTECDLVIVETLTRGDVRRQVLQSLKSITPTPQIAPADYIVARGALEAARRHAEGEPVYFDFLPQISTIVQRAKGPESYDLIEAEATLPAGRIYRSPKPASFQIQAGQSEFSVYLRKELAKWPRKAKVDIGAPLPARVPVALSVEQAPAAGRAKVFINASSLSRQFTVDWDRAEEIQQPWDDLIAALDMKIPTIPNRLVLPCGMDGWLDTARGPGLASLLEETASRADVDWKSLADKLSSRPGKKYCISSDGVLPDEVSEYLRGLLDEMAERAIAHVAERVAGRVQANNDSLRFLTWQFRRAPHDLPRKLLDIWSARFDGHPLGIKHSDLILFYQGFGRTCRTEIDERDAIDRIFLRPVEDWSYRQETAAIAFLLSRSDTAPLMLERDHVEKLVNRVLIEFADELGGDYTKFNYAPFLLAGLLRWRLKMSHALVLGQDPLAEKIQSAINDIIDDFGRERNRSVTFMRAVSRYESLLQQLLAELAGQGGNPDILSDLYDAG